MFLAADSALTKKGVFKRTFQPNKNMNTVKIIFKYFIESYRKCKHTYAKPQPTTILVY